MKYFLILAISCFSFSFINWQSSFEKAQQNAKSNHQLILLNFSGSDWCGPCMRMHKEIFSSEIFSKFADTALQMVNADFPRKAKNQLNSTIQKQNNYLAEKYNPKGKFPFTLLLDANGKIIKAWDGLPKESASQFASSLNNICISNK